MELNEASHEIVTVNTHRGLFKYKRLPYGVSSGPAIFQRAIEGMLQDIPNVGVFLDNILITGPTDEDYLRSLKIVLDCLQKANLRLKRVKCHLMQLSHSMLGHQVDAEGFVPMPSKAQAVQEAPIPRNPTQLRSYLGLVNFYAKYLLNLAAILTPLHELLHENVQWHWEEEQDKASNKANHMLQSAKVLVHYASAKALVVACDASPYGVGAAPAMGSERLIAFASHTLTPAEKNYTLSLIGKHWL